VRSFLRKSAAASVRSGLEREQFSMKAVTVKFGEFKREWMSITSNFLWGHGFSVMSRRVVRRVFFSLGSTKGEANHCRGNLSAGRRRGRS